ncbi:HD family hydrolase, partial [Escherichia coli]|nr:HD family hydrolase [Escherichia coli]
MQRIYVENKVTFIKTFSGKDFYYYRIKQYDTDINDLDDSL